MPGIDAIRFVDPEIKALSAALSAEQDARKAWETELSARNLPIMGRKPLLHAAKDAAEIMQFQTEGQKSFMKRFNEAVAGSMLARQKLVTALEEQGFEGRPLAKAISRCEHLAQNAVGRNGEVMERPSHLPKDHKSRLADTYGIGIGHKSDGGLDISNLPEEIIRK